MRKKRKDLGFAKFDTTKNLGAAMENLIRRVLDILKSKGIILRYEKNEVLDSMGIDFLIILPTNEEIPLQVKSSTNRQKNHRKKYPGIPSIAGVDRIKQREKNIMRIIAAFKKGIVLHLNHNSSLNNKKNKPKKQSLS